MKRKVSLYYNRITIGLRSVASSSTSLKHTVQAVPPKKKKDRRRKQKTKEKDRMKGKRKKGKRKKGKR